jgi:hypothetical protein
MAIGPQQEQPVVVKFDWFHLEAADEPDTTAPTTEIAWNPEAPDGAEGWYRTAPTFTLEATDGEGSGVAGTEYRLGEGEWTAYSGPVEVASEGETTVSYRSSDAEGNVEEPVTATVKVDTVAPTLTGAPTTAAAGSAPTPTCTSRPACPTPRGWS